MKTNYWSYPDYFFLPVILVVSWFFGCFFNNIPMVYAVTPRLPVIRNLLVTIQSFFANLNRLSGMYHMCPTLALAAGNNGTITSAVYSAPGKTGQALDFDGDNDYVSTTNADVIDLDIGLNQGLTISAWIKPDSDGEGDQGRIFTKNTGTWRRIDSESGGLADLECSLNLTADATLNVSDGSIGK
jgi:hypothetical protein